MERFTLASLVSEQINGGSTFLRSYRSFEAQCSKCKRTTAHDHASQQYSVCRVCGKRVRRKMRK